MNKLNLLKLIFVLAVGILFLPAKTVFSQQNQDQGKVVAYLQSYLKVNSQKPGSLRNRFTELVPLPADLEVSLLSAFPRHRFYVAKTLFTHWMPDDGEANILVVTNAANGKVVGHKWAVWFSNGTESFNHILAAYQAQSPEVALETVTILSKLIVSLNNWKIGKVQIKNRIITAELGGSEQPWRVLKVKIDSHNRFGRVAFINPKNGKEM